jgi:NAD+--dinitrogen-reductase ADP-D-ribosyltransferase
MDTDMSSLSPTSCPPRITYAVNRCNLPAWIIGSEDFNRSPASLSISGVRESNRHFFEKLDGIPDRARRALVFHDYLSVKFALHQWRDFTGNSRSSLRNSYLRFLNGWGVDSNGIEGAVLKSWVQSRFGVAPTYHRSLLRNDSSGEEDARYAYDRMRGRARTNAIDAQLDLLYEFCQYELRRRSSGETVLTLFRGTNDPEEHIVRRIQSRRRCVVRLNNLVSFTADRERAWEFGSTVWKTTVAVAKIVFFSSLLGGSVLCGEAEYLVVGGDYEVEELLF